MERWKEKTNRHQQVLACIMASIYNVYRKNSDRARSFEDYLPFTLPPRQLSEAESVEALDAFFNQLANHNGKVTNG